MACIPFSSPDGGHGYICTSLEDSGRFLFWTWELYKFSGVNWLWMADTRFEKTLNPGRWSPLWLIYYAQCEKK